MFCDICFNPECECGPKPCEPCKANGQPNCGNDWCHTRSSEDEKAEWIADCGVCSAKTKTTWSQVIHDGCPVCGTHQVSIYHETSLRKEQSKE